uniref:Uncharacterized protein n=1 Tax=Amblyomma tuberculatum TaxID=48802 RepID=A0A6M2E1X5_9ACAR
MFALVRFLSDHDGKVHRVPATNIKEFEPADDTDFDPKFVYAVFWHEQENSGHYPAQILMMAETEEKLNYKQQNKRVRIAKIPVSEYEIDESESDHAPLLQKGKQVYFERNLHSKEV